jgi:hypothetical protein
MIKSFNLVLFIFLVFTGYSQKQFAHNWCFGYEHMFNFNTMSFTSGISQMEALEASVSISDSCGDLLFYSNGGGIEVMPSFLGGVWNKNHQLMPNGDITGFGGCTSSYQGTLAIPDPGSANEFYLFNVDCYEHDSSNYQSLNYSKIDMSLDGGLGDVALKGVSLRTDYMLEFVTAAKHINNVDYWLISASRDSTFHVYKVSNNGVFYDASYPSSNRLLGVAKLSPDGTKLFCGSLFDFDPSTGGISNPIDLGLNLTTALDFSPNSQVLYLAERHYDTVHTTNYYQFDLSSSNIPATAQLIGIVPLGIPRAMQLTPNGEIYGNDRSIDSICVIHSPNTLGIGCDFERNVLKIPASTPGGMIDYSRFPNYVSSWLVNSVSCNAAPVGTSELENSRKQTELARYNFLGQKIGKKTSGLQLVVYDDGSTKKVFVSSKE